MAAPSTRNIIPLLPTAAVTFVGPPPPVVVDRPDDRRYRQPQPVIVLSGAASVFIVPPKPVVVEPVLRRERAPDAVVLSGVRAFTTPAVVMPPAPYVVGAAERARTVPPPVVINGLLASITATPAATEQQFLMIMGCGT